MTMRLFTMYDDLLLLQALDGRDEYIYHDDNPPCTEKSRESSFQGGYRESGEGENCKPILDFVFLVRPLLELQRKERHLAYQEIAGDEDKCQYYPYRPSITTEPEWVEDNQRPPEEGTGWCRNTNEGSGLAFVQDVRKEGTADIFRGIMVSLYVKGKENGHVQAYAPTGAMVLK